MSLKGLGETLLLTVCLCHCFPPNSTLGSATLGKWEFDGQKNKERFCKEEVEESAEEEDSCHSEFTTFLKLSSQKVRWDGSKKQTSA